MSSPSSPRVMSAGFWQSIMPQALRNRKMPKLREIDIRSKFTGPWNPATYFVVMALCVGSNAINLIALKKYTLNYTRTTEAKLSLLREVLGRVQDGEDVDVEGLLGKGIPESEREWEEVMKDLERGDDLPLLSRTERRGFKAARAAAANKRVEAVNDVTVVTGDADVENEADRPQSKPGFY